MSWCLKLGLFLLIVCIFVKSSRMVPQVDSRCLDCLCQANMNCDYSQYSHNLYGITWPYWDEAGRPGDRGQKHDFETCLNNKSCAEEAVRGYMRKYGRDCDATGTIDCYDFARIHKLGSNNCGSESIFYTEYWKQFKMCYEPHNFTERYNHESC